MILPGRMRHTVDRVRTQVWGHRVGQSYRNCRRRTHLEIRVPIGYHLAPLGYLAWYLGYFIRSRVLRDEKGTSRQQRVLQNRKGAPPGSNNIADNFH